MTFFEKLRFLSSAIGQALWPFLKKFLQAESKVLMESAAEAVRKVAADQTLKGTGWQGKTAAAIGYVVADMATKGVDVGIDVIIDYIRVEYAKYVQETSLPQS